MTNESSRCSWSGDLAQQVFSVTKLLNSNLFLPAKLATPIHLYTGTVANLSVQYNVTCNRQ